MTYIWQEADIKVSVKGMVTRMELEFDVKITPGVLYDYMVHHTYTSLSGIFGTLTGVLILFLFFARGGIIYLIAGCVILLYLPCSLYLRSHRQVLSNPAFKKSLHYRLTDAGLEVSQDGQAQMQEWDTIVKAVATRCSIIVYTSPVNASIFPRRDLKEQAVAVISFLSTHVPPDKIKIRG